MPQRRQATGKATLAPVARRKNGKVYWLARGQVPERRADGSLGSRRHERGFGPDITTDRKRIAQCEAWNIEIEERFKNPRQLITFSRAYKNYLGKGHPLPLKALGILEFLGDRPCTDIDDTLMDELGRRLWPGGAAVGTLNRHLYTPVISILHMALKNKAPELQRPKGHRDVHPVVIPPESWYRTLWPHLNPNQKAFVAFLAMHGRRTSEALGRSPQDLNPQTGILDLGKTKTGVRQVALHPGSLQLIVAMPKWESRKWLFGCGPESDNSFRRDLHKACMRAGLEWYHPHSFGRHTSVTRMLQAGWSVAHVADAHGMTPEMVMRRYGHLTKKETTAALHAVGGELFQRIFNTGGNVGLAGALIDLAATEHRQETQETPRKLTG